jgi:hypothetical protein
MAALARDAFGGECIVRITIDCALLRLRTARMAEQARYRDWPRKIRVRIQFVSRCDAPGFALRVIANRRLEEMIVNRKLSPPEAGLGEHMAFTWKRL